MSISVEHEHEHEHEQVRATATELGSGAFLLTVTDDGRPHVVAVTVRWDGDSLVMGAGRGSTRNATDRPGISLLWPPGEPGGYSLIVDGEASVEPGDDGGRVTVEVTRAVLHRPMADDAAAVAETGCRSDCVPLLRR